MEATIRLPRLHDGQRRVLREAARFNVVCCGRRWGKTVLGIDRIVHPLLSGKPVGLFCPTDKALYEPWSELVRLLDPITTLKDKQKKRLELVTGGVLDGWTLDGGIVARGRKYARVIVDEAAHSGRIGEAWNKEIRPTLADFKGDAWFLSTPKGRGPFATFFAKGQDSQDLEWRSWRMPTESNPHIDPAEVEAMRAGLPTRVAEQEVDALILDDDGGVFRNVVAAIDQGRSKPSVPKPGVRYRMGVDVARVQDYNVIDVFGPDGSQVDHERWNLTSWEVTIDRISSKARHWNGAEVVLDSTGVGDPIRERLQGKVRLTPYHFINESKRQAIDALCLRFDHGTIRLMDLPVQTAELQAFAYTLTKARNIVMSAPEGMHDDCVMALALVFAPVSRPSWTVS